MSKSPRKSVPVGSHSAPTETVATRPAESRVLSSRSFAWPEATVLVAALGVRGVLLAQLGTHPLLQPNGALDDAAYAQLARRVAAGDLALAPGPYFLSPFYTYFLGGVFALTRGSILAARVVQILLGTAAVAFVGATAATWFGRRAGLVAGALAALTGLFAFNELLILQSSVDPFLTALGLYLLSRALRAPSPGGFLLAGSALGALVLNRPNALPAVLGCAALWFALHRPGAGFKHAAALVLGVSLLVGPVTARNRLVTGEWVALTAHGGLNFFIGNGEGADGTWRQVPGISPTIQGQEEDIKRVAGEALKRDVSAKEADDYFYGRAWTWVRQNPANWLRVLFRKALLTVSAADPALNYSYAYFAHDERTLLPVLFVGPWLLFPVGIFGLIVAEVGNRKAWLTWLSFAPVYALTLVAFFVSSRYRLPLLPVMIVGSAAAVEWLIARLTVSGFPRGITARDARRLAAFAVLCLLVNWPVRVNDGRINEREQYIVTLLDDGQTAQAAQLLEGTLPLHPRPALLLDRVALVYREKGDAARALKYFQRAYQADGNDPRVRLNLGEQLLQAGRAEEALPHLEAALQSGVSPYTSAFDTAQALLAVGRAADARSLLAEVGVASDIAPSGLIELANLALRLEDPANAERFARAAAERDRGNAEAHHTLGVTLAAEGRLQDAIGELQQAVTLRPTIPMGRVHLALALIQGRQLEQARVVLLEALQSDPGDEDARQLLEKIRQ